MSVTSDDLAVLRFSAISAIDLIEELREVVISYLLRSDGDDLINPSEVEAAARALLESGQILGESARWFIEHEGALRYLRLANISHAKPILICGRHSTSWHEAADGERLAMLDLLGRMLPRGRIADIDQFLRGFRRLLEWPGQNQDPGIPDYLAVMDGIALEHDRAERWLNDDGEAQATLCIDRGGSVAALDIMDQQKTEPEHIDRQPPVTKRGGSRNPERDNFIFRRRQAGDSWSDIRRAMKERFGAAISSDGVRKAYKRMSGD